MLDSVNSLFSKMKITGFDSNRNLKHMMTEIQKYYNKTGDFKAYKLLIPLQNIIDNKIQKKMMDKNTYFEILQTDIKRGKT